MPTKTNEPDDEAIMRALGPKEGWHDTALRRRTGLPKDGNATRRNFSDGGVVDVYDVSSPGTPNSETDGIPRDSIRRLWEARALTHCPVLALKAAMKEAGFDLDR
jgi:hypothetical protein